MEISLAQSLTNAKIVCWIDCLMLWGVMIFFFSEGIAGIVNSERRKACWSMAVSLLCGFLLATLPDQVVFDMWIKMARRP